MASQSSDPTGPAPVAKFSGYERFVVALLAFLQFTIVLDFMILSPLGAILMKELNVPPAKFGVVVSGYAVAAGISGLFAAGFADRFDRKKLLLVFYAGFILGTLFCALAPNYQLLLAARIFTGFFGGVIGSVTMAIVADVFPLERRGRVMGSIQSAFGAAQVLGLPLGLWLAAHFGWHFGFLLIVVVSLVVGIAIVLWLKPINAHLAVIKTVPPLLHIFRTARNPRYQVGFLATILLSTGGFMLMPFASAFSVNNLGLTLKQLPMIYMVTGICSLIAGPLLGRASDRFGKFPMLVAGSILASSMILIYVRLGVTPIWEVIVLNVFMYIGISARMVSSGALVSAMPDLADRGAYMSISSSMQQLSGGVATWVAGLVVFQTESGKLDHYPTLGWMVLGSMATCLVLMYRVHRIVSEKKAAGTAPVVVEPEPIMEA
ncbi:MAG: hypothetical protein JWO82_3904 [Akkermansiaceae bacterium]|nr:hypothetical protein [Akkermansiaceae bacterium]